jgi:LacI family transcriptional regulator
MPLADAPKYLDVSRRIESEIASGRWRGGRMPGVREIAATHGVSAVTASRALQVLREKGLIRSVQRSGNYPVDVAAGAATPSRDDRRWGLYFRTTPGPWQWAASSVTMRGFEVLAAGRGLSFAADLFAIGDDTGPAGVDRQVRAAIDRGVAGVFFLPTRISEPSLRQDEGFLEGCRGAGLPVVLVERNLRGDGRPLAADLVATDDSEGGYRCTSHLIDGGRRRIAFVYAAPTSSHNDRLAGYLLALHRAGLADLHPPIVLEHRLDVPSRDGHGRLAAAIIASGADGVVCYQDTAAIGLIVELLARRVRIPEDIAIVGFEDLPIGSSFSLGLTTYWLNPEAIAAEAFRLMERRIAEPSSPPLKVLVPGRLIVRESSGGVDPAG